MARTINPSGIRKDNTTIADDGRTVRVTLYGTEIFTWDRPTGTVTLNCGGFCTPTTFRRMNECLYHYGLSHRVNGGIRVGASDFKASDTLTLKASK